MVGALDNLRQRIVTGAGDNDELLTQIDYARVVLSWKGRDGEAGTLDISPALKDFPPYRRFTVYRRFEPAWTGKMTAKDYQSFRTILTSIKDDPHWSWLFGATDRKLSEYLDRQLATP